MRFHYIYIYLARTPEIGQGLGRILSCGARKPEQAISLYFYFIFIILFILMAQLRLKVSYSTI